jgi:hypothetical protein
MLVCKHVCMNEDVLYVDTHDVRMYTCSPLNAHMHAEAHVRM